MPCFNTCGSIGSNFKMAVEPSITTGDCEPATFNANSVRFEIINENMRFTDVTIGSSGLTGSLDPIANHLRPGTRLVFGRILMEVGPNELAYWLPRILGGSQASGTTFSTGESFVKRPVDILMDREGGAVIYRGCLVNRALLQGRSASDDDPDVQILRLALDFVGIEEHESAWPSPGPGLPTAQRLFWIFGDSKLELDIDVNSSPAATEFSMDAFNLLINNQISVKTRNHLTATCLRPNGRDIRFQAPIPYTAQSHANFYAKNFDGAGRLLFRGTKNLAGSDEETFRTDFVFPRLFQTRETPNTRGRTEIPLSIDLMAYRTASGEPLTVTNII